MHSKNRRRRHDAPQIDAAFAESLSARGAGRQRRSKPDYKTQQLCRQVERVLALALAGECHDDVLRDLLVESVAPFPDANRLLVRVVLPRHAADRSVIDVMERLARVHGVLRRAMAHSINRKRAPELTFLPLSASAGAGEVNP